MDLEDAEDQQEHEGRSLYDDEDGYAAQNGDEQYDDDDDADPYLRYAWLLSSLTLEMLLLLLLL